MGLRHPVLAMLTGHRNISTRRQAVEFRWDAQNTSGREGGGGGRKSDAGNVRRGAFCASSPYCLDPRGHSVNTEVFLVRRRKRVLHDSLYTL